MTHPIPLDPTDVALLRLHALEARAREALLDDQIEVLVALHDALVRRADPLAGRRAARRADAPTEEVPPTRFPVLRLLRCPIWSETLGALAGVPGAFGKSHVLLQSRDRQLYLRFQGPARPTAATLTWYPGGEYPGEGQQRRHPARRLDPKIRPFALDCLNGGDPHGDLWFVPGADPAALLGPDGGRVELAVRLPGRDAPVALGLLRVHPLPRGAVPATQPTPVRLGWEDGTGRRTSGEHVLMDALRAYVDGDADAFRAALLGDAETFRSFLDGTVALCGPQGTPSSPLLDRRGHAEASGHPTRRSPWAFLPRWQVLWLRALLAEIEREGPETMRAWGGDLVRWHPQVDETE